MTKNQSSGKTGRPTLAFIVTEDWFFVSHFLPMVEAAREAGFDPIVITRVRAHAARIEAAGARVVPLEAERGSLNPAGMIRTVLRLRTILRREHVELAHAIALRSIVLGGLAARLAGVQRQVYAVTGGGYLSTNPDLLTRIFATVLVGCVRSAISTRSTHYLFENTDDPRTFGLDPADRNVTVVGGAGVDPKHFAHEPWPPAAPPLRVALVSRMLWSKGVDLIVEAVGMARRQGVDVTLSLFGAPDPSNPKAITRQQLDDWSARDGIRWDGVTDDVRRVWREHHLACLPSRGGEGLPRSMLEAAACGRAILTTDVPGCRSFVRNRVDGLVVPPQDAAALCRGLVQLAADRPLLEAMGRNARSRVLDGYTEAQVQRRVADMYGRFRQDRPAASPLPGSPQA